MSERVYGPGMGYARSELFGQINRFPDGQFVAEYEGVIVGYCATFMISSDVALKPHTWNEITGTGFAARHDPDGDMLYGMDVMVHPDYRRLRIGERFYRIRRELCQWLELKGIVFGGRMPGYARHAKGISETRRIMSTRSSTRSSRTRSSISSCARASSRSVSCATTCWAMRSRRIAPRTCCGKIRWSRTRSRRSPASAIRPCRNGCASPPSSSRCARSTPSTNSSSRSNISPTSPLTTNPTLSSSRNCSRFSSCHWSTGRSARSKSIEKISEYTPRYIEFMEKLAVSYNVNIIGGTHPSMMENGDILNISYVFLRDGSVHTQQKLHPTPSERMWWNIKGGEGALAIQTDCGPIGVMICYDSEFPELARHLVDQGALMLFVPFCTDERRGYMRVRYCCQARAVENQCYVTLSGVVGNLPNVENMDIHYAESCILTPSDFPFARDGVAADTAPNTETIALADLSLSDLLTARQSGAVQNLKDRRFDLYSVKWKKRR
jgi:predicted amidohydrolase/GNAT superfamily N-acetyltransferase